MKALYTHSEEVHNMTAPREVVPHVMELVRSASILDVGCGIGTWLKAFEEAGVSEYTGVDGEYVDRSLLKIPADKFVAKDLRTSWSLNRKFDLVISFEVAEHLPEECADLFVETSAAHGDTILFSAAIPGQGGQNHLNEQWPEYWQKKFLKHGLYFHDVIRPLIWDNEKVHWWYRQNIFLLKKEKSKDRIFRCVHPTCFNFHIKMLNEMNASLKSGQLGVVYSFQILLGAIRSFVIRKIK